MISARAAIVHEARQDYQIEPVELEAPRADEAVVRILGVGMCHTDEEGRGGRFPISFPAVFGHEGSGVIEQVGEAVTTVSPADAVVLSFRSCGRCSSCSRDEPAYCRDFARLNLTGAREDGSKTIRSAQHGPLGSPFFGQSSFATRVLVHTRNLVKVDMGDDLALLGPLGCGVQTGAGAVLRSLDCTKDASLLVIGGGAVGLSAVLAAVYRGCRPIIVVEPRRTRADLALDLGADYTFDPSEGFEAAIRQIIPQGVDYAIDCSGRAGMIMRAMTCLAKRGKLGLTGVPQTSGESIPLDLGETVMAGRSIRGIVEGDSDPAVFIPELLALYRTGRFPFDRLIRTYPFESINEARAAQHDGSTIKPVLLMNAGDGN